jgi:hypothetical protein
MTDKKNGARAAVRSKITRFTPTKTRAVNLGESDHRIAAAKAPTKQIDPKPAGMVDP